MCVQIILFLHVQFVRVKRVLRSLLNAILHCGLASLLPITDIDKSTHGMVRQNQSL